MHEMWFNARYWDRVEIEWELYTGRVRTRGIWRRLVLDFLALIWSVYMFCYNVRNNESDAPHPIDVYDSRFHELAELGRILHASEYNNISS